MSRYNDISIKKLVDGINKDYYLPDIQRPFVWGDNRNEFEEKVSSLFDSILKNYPIGTLLFWRVDKERIEKDGLNLLEFLNNSNKNENENIKYISNEKDYILVLDGQQRMTVFNLVFRGVFEDYYRKKLRKRNLYFNLLTDTSNFEEDLQNSYEFKFFEESKGDNFYEKDKLWFKVKSVLEVDEIIPKTKELRKEFNLEEEKESIVGSNLEKLKNSISNENLSYYEIEKKKKDDEALEIFVRVNSKGTVLSYSDLLFSKITHNWKDDENSMNAREVFNEFLESNNYNSKGINKYGEGFKFTNDFILKTSLVLIDKEIRYKLKNFNSENIELIKNNWDKITLSIQKVVSFLTKIGINSHKMLRSNNALIPLIYFIYHNNLQTKDIELNSENRYFMQKYIYTVLLNGVFGGQTDQLLNDTREVIRSNNSSQFPLNDVIRKLSQRRSVRKGEEIRDLLDEVKYNTDKSKIILSILYGSEIDNDYQEDHIFPQKKTSKVYSKDLVNNIGNIQILKRENQVKNNKDFKTYREDIIKLIPNYDSLNYIPSIDNELKDYTLDYFEIFISKRKELIYNKVKDYFIF